MVGGGAVATRRGAARCSTPAPTSCWCRRRSRPALQGLADAGRITWRGAALRAGRRRRRLAGPRGGRRPGRGRARSATARRGAAGLLRTRRRPPRRDRLDAGGDPARPGDRRGARRRRPAPGGGRPRRDPASGSRAGAIVAADADEAGAGRVALVGGRPGRPGADHRRGAAGCSPRPTWWSPTGSRPGCCWTSCARTSSWSTPRRSRTGRRAAQEEINRILVDRARAGQVRGPAQGRRPVRLRPRRRGGAGLRGGRRAGDAWCPGVTSAIAVPAAAGIPVTHRGVAHEFTVVSGHLPPDHPESLVDWAGAGPAARHVVRPDGAEEPAGDRRALPARSDGRAPDTPAAVIQEGTTRDQRVVRAHAGARSRTR